MTNLSSLVLPSHPYHIRGTQPIVRLVAVCARGRGHQKALSSSAGDASMKAKVAVIGAGAAGLVAARELIREGHCVKVFEQGATVGGVWVYTDQVEDDMLGTDPNRSRVHTSMYSNLRTNLPREIMAFTDFPFEPAFMRKRSRDSRRFCGHAEACLSRRAVAAIPVEAYLQAFAQAYGLERFVQCRTRVTRVEPLPTVSGSCTANGAAPLANGVGPLASGTAPGANGANSPANGSAAAVRRRWRVTSEPVADDARLSPVTVVAAPDAANSGEVEDFEAVVVCNGHYSEPRLPPESGADVFPGMVMHTHSYREPSPFTGQRIVVVGASASGEDISREIATVAKKVFLSARSRSPKATAQAKPFGDHGNIYRVPGFERMDAEGGVHFSDGRSVPCVDTVLFATGYVYNFPFLRGPGIVTVEDNRVSPLYKHLFPPAYAPSLSFVGLPWKIVPFPLYELQSRWVARLLSGRVHLPSVDDMMADVRAFDEQLARDGIAPRYAHRMDKDIQWRYDDWLAEQCGPDTPPLPKWRQHMYEITGENKREFPDKYRDVWRDHAMLEQAQAHSERMKATLTADEFVANAA